jgi:hypothetical protein
MPFKKNLLPAKPASAPFGAKIVRNSAPPYSVALSEMAYLFGNLIPLPIPQPVQNADLTAML